MHAHDGAGREPIPLLHEVPCAVGRRILRYALVLVLLAIALTVPRVAAAQDRAEERLDWETGQNRSYLIPALEIPGFIAALNQFNRRAFDSDDYDTDWDSIWKNLRTAPRFDRDPFDVNQLGHPYQGGIYYGAARSAGLSYWESALYTLAGSFLWETAGETTRPSINDHVATGIGGTFVGEALFRMASLLLEGGGTAPGFWREVGAAVISPPTGFNRLVFGDRFDSVFPSRDPALSIRLRLGATVITRVRNEGLATDVDDVEASIDFSMLYGLPGKPGYRYTRPFDFFVFNFTAVPDADSVDNAIENVTIQGLLAGRAYAWGADYRGVWGLFGGFDYLSPQIFRLSSTSVSVGTAAQWWPARTIAVQGLLLGGVGFGAAGTVADREQRDYHYGVIPQTLVGLRLIAGDRAVLEVTARQFYVVGVGEGAGSRERVDLDLVNRGIVGLTVRLSGPHALGIQYVVSARDARFSGLRDRHQTIETFTLAYSFLGQRRFGATEWRSDQVDR